MPRTTLFAVVMSALILPTIAAAADAPGDGGGTPARVAAAEAGPCPAGRRPRRRCPQAAARAHRPASSAPERPASAFRSRDRRGRARARRLAGRRGSGSRSSRPPGYRRRGARAEPRRAAWKTATPPARVRSRSAPDDSALATFPCANTPSPIGLHTAPPVHETNGRGRTATGRDDLLAVRPDGPARHAIRPRLGVTRYFSPVARRL